MQPHGDTAKRYWPRTEHGTRQRMKEDLHLSIADDTGSGPALSVIVPSFNERPNVAPMIAKLDAALRGVEWEVIYVDDNSPDGTAASGALAAAVLPPPSSRARCLRRPPMWRSSMAICSTTRPDCR